MKRLVKKSENNDFLVIKDVITSLLNKDKVKKYILKDLEDFAKEEFEFNNDLDEDDVLENYRDALKVDMQDIIEYLIEEIVEEFNNKNIDDETAEDLAYTDKFIEPLIEEVFETYISDMSKVVEEEKEDANEMYGI